MSDDIVGSEPALWEGKASYVLNCRFFFFYVRNDVRFEVRAVLLLEQI